MVSRMEFTATVARPRLQRGDAENHDIPRVVRLSADHPEMGLVRQDLQIGVSNLQPAFTGDSARSSALLIDESMTQSASASSPTAVISSSDLPAARRMSSGSIG